MIVQEPIQAAIWHCLNHYAYNDAVFLSERLYAEVKSDETLFLLATSYYRSGLKNHAYAILKKHPGSSPQCRYLFASCATDLNKYSEAETAITGSDSQRSLDELIAEFGDQASFALQLLAKICVKTERKTKAAEAFKRALKINPFLWTCFVELCNKGEKPDANRVFQLNGLENLSTCHGVYNTVNVESIVTPALQNIIQQDHGYQTTPSSVTVLQSSVNTTKMCTPDESPLANPLALSGITSFPQTRMKPVRYRGLLGNASSISPMTPSFGIIHWDSSSPDTYYGTPIVPQPTLTEANDQKSLAKRVRAHVGQLINRKETPLQVSKPVFSQSSNVPSAISSPSSPASLTSLATQNVRRSSRLFSNSYSVKENNKSPNRNKFATPKSPSRKSNKRLAKSNLNKNVYSELNARNREKERSETITSAENKIANSAISNNTNVNNNYNNLQQSVIIQKQCAEGLMQLMRTLGQAYAFLAQFECKKAIECLSAVSPQQFNTAWVQCLLGAAFFEMAEYERSVEYFSEVHKREPHRLQYMEIYSTALWHLQKEVALSALAQDLIKLDRNSPVTWCVSGNCFSLHKEHDTAVKFFQRAVQVDPTFTYAYTLLGHEYVMTEELDKAMSSFRLAICLDFRHYNAWFGIGTIYSKQERYKLAEINYLRALSINTHSSVLMCHIGVVQHALKQVDKALQTLNAAIANDPKNPLCKFHRGQVYFNVGRHAEALKELEELKEIVPKESLVYYLIGKVHRKLGNTDLALMHFSWATDLDPKGASSQIKEAFDPSVGRAHTDDESPQSPSAEDFPSESNSVPQQETSQEELAFNGLPEDSDSDIL